VTFLKKLIALVISASMLLLSVSVMADNTTGKTPSVDAVTSATETTPTPTPVPTKPAVKPVVNPTVKPTTTPVVKSTYKDGVYVAWGNANVKGIEGAKVTIKGGKIAGIELMKTGPKLINRDAKFNNKEISSAYEPMKQRLLGKTKEEAAKVKVVSDDTISSNEWKLAVDRAFVRALIVKPKGQVYFAGEHMGVDPQGKFVVFAKYDKTKLIGVKAYMFNTKGELLEATALDSVQTTTINTVVNAILKNGTSAKPIKGIENVQNAITNAFRDAERNAKLAPQTK